MNDAVVRRQNCLTQGCNKAAQGQKPLCKAHGGGRRCMHPGCPRSARDRTDLCIAHGGGKRCLYQGCTTSARSGTVRRARTCRPSRTSGVGTHRSCGYRCHSGILPLTWPYTLCDALCGATSQVYCSLHDGVVKKIQSGMLTTCVQPCLAGGSTGALQHPL